MILKRPMIVKHSNICFMMWFSKLIKCRLPNPQFVQVSLYKSSWEYFLADFLVPTISLPPPISIFNLKLQFNGSTPPPFLCISTQKTKSCETKSQVHFQAVCLIVEFFHLLSFYLSSTCSSFQVLYQCFWLIARLYHANLKEQNKSSNYPTNFMALTNLNYSNQFYGINQS